MFATVDELAEELEVTFTEAQQRKAFRRLESATDAIRECCHLTISRVAGDTVNLAGNWSTQLVLPEVPVVSVSAVTVDGTTFTAGTHYDRVGRVLWRRGLNSYDPATGQVSDVPNPHLHWGGPSALVVVTYTHGWDPVPPVVRGICLAMSARGFNSPDGVQQESIGGYSVTYGSSTVAGANALLPAEKATLRNLSRQWLEAA